MNRRRRFSEPFSLFAFQDVMAAVIGILFFVVLLMSFDIVNQQPVSAQTPAAGRDLSEQHQQLEQLDSLARQLEEDIRRAGRLIRMASADDNAILQEVTAIDRTLRSIHDRIIVEQEAIVTVQRNSQLDKMQDAALNDELEQLERQMVELGQKLRAAEGMPRLAYIVDSRARERAPWLIEVTAQQYRVAPAHAVSGQLIFKAASLAERDRQLLEWAAGQDKSRYYFCILVKPSGIGQSISIERRLEELGFELGRDLLPEDWNVVPQRAGD